MNIFANSMKLVLSSLTHTKTKQEILNEIKLSPRTFRFAVSKLKKIGLVEEITSLKDARMKYCRRGVKNER